MPKLKYLYKRNIRTQRWKGMDRKLFLLCALSLGPKIYLKIGWVTRTGYSAKGIIYLVKEIRLVDSREGQRIWPFERVLMRERRRERWLRLSLRCVIFAINNPPELKS